MDIGPNLILVSSRPIVHFLIESIFNIHIGPPHSSIQTSVIAKNSGKNRAGVIRTASCVSRTA